MKENRHQINMFRQCVSEEGACPMTTNNLPRLLNKSTTVQFEPNRTAKNVA